MTTPPDPNNVTNLPSAENAAASSPAVVQREPQTREWWSKRVMIALAGVAVGAACPYLPWPLATSVCSAVAAFVRGVPGLP